MVAGIVAGLQGAGKIIEGNFFRVCGRCTHHHGDLVFRKKHLGALAHTAGDDHVGAALRQPARQYAGFVRWGNDIFPAGDAFCGRIDFDDGELFTVTKMGAQLTCVMANCSQ